MGTCWLLASVLHAASCVWQAWQLDPQNRECCSIAASPWTGRGPLDAADAPAAAISTVPMAAAPPFPHELGIGTNKWKLKHIDAVQATFGAALDAGISLFDTAQCYASSEACLGYVRKRDASRLLSRSSIQSERWS